MALLQRHEGHTEVKTDRYWALRYYFETLDNKQQHQRREYLDRYGFVAQSSVLVVFALFQISFFFAWLLRSGAKHNQPKSPSFDKRANGKLGWLKSLRSGGKRADWWLKKEVVSGWNWGTRGEWLGAIVWATWLFYLCIAHTGKGMHMEAQLRS